MSPYELEAYRIERARAHMLALASLRELTEACADARMRLADSSMPLPESTARNMGALLADLNRAIGMMNALDAVGEAG